MPKRKCTGANCPMQVGYVVPEACPEPEKCRYATFSQTNADRVRNMTDEELANIINRACPPEGTKCNPPYGREIGKWVQKAYTEHVHGDVTIVMLIPARTDTSYFHDYIYGKAEIRFLRGRLKFEDENGAAMNPAPFPSMVVIYR